MLKIISIVTVVFNDHIGLRKTLNSISNQVDNSFELLIVDGGSTDGTLDVVKEYGGLVSCLISENDDGIYDAMNKGLNHSNGEWIIFMNAGDEFLSKNTLSSALKKMNDPDTTYFGRAKIMGDGQNSWLYPDSNISVSNIDKWLRHKLPNHQAIFFPKSFYAINRFNLNFVISSDSDYKLRALKGRYAFLDITVCKFYLGGLSSNYTFKNALQQFRDRLRRTSGQGGWFYALDGLMRSLVKVMLSKIFRESSHGLIDRLKRLGGGR